MQRIMTLAAMLLLAGALAVAQKNHEQTRASHQGRVASADHDRSGTIDQAVEESQNNRPGGTIRIPQHARRNRASRTAARHSNNQRTGIAERADEANKAYEPRPKAEAAHTTMPNPPLDHPRPEDQTPSVGTATPAHSRASARVQSSPKRGKTNRHRKSASSNQSNSAPSPPQL